MGYDKNNNASIDNIVLNDDGAGLDSWKAAEEKNIREALSLSYTERFRIMTRLMRMNKMFSRAKITHKKMP
jgi:hypothetical protein